MGAGQAKLLYMVLRLTRQGRVCWRARQGVIFAQLCTCHSLISPRLAPCCRAVDDGKGQKMGGAGEAELICDRCISSQPVSGFDWSPDKAGLFVAAAFDQTVRVGMVSQLAAL